MPLSPEEIEYEMAVHIATAFKHVKEAKAYAGGDPITAGPLNDAGYALFRLWENVSEENRRLVDLLAIGEVEELRPIRTRNRG